MTEEPTKLTDCPSCGMFAIHPQIPIEEGSIYMCEGCKAIYGECSYMKSLEYVHSTWHDGGIKDDPDAIRYYDFTCEHTCNQELTYRRHGWFNVNTRKIVQTG